jgi:hypothetical protein
MKENKGTMKISNNFRSFAEKFGQNRVKVGVDVKTIPLCHVPDLIVRYFKSNNDRYLELVNMELENGDR